MPIQLSPKPRDPTEVSFDHFDGEAILAGPVPLQAYDPEGHPPEEHDLETDEALELGAFEEPAEGSVEAVAWHTHDPEVAFVAETAIELPELDPEEMELGDWLAVEKVQALPCSESDKDAILEGNARRLLKL
jgi:hypothetical protein